ncbi:O-antigen ligase [Tepidibacillus sp. HK-1]|uniref:O-antigen ligase family protein n=1 Tax=Tepidibacillus sp. HK-1 TaxID=1883407 RepID=UPI00085342EA|nr:O-antigen ligase family protein [Tepidibacillus sp. HK-1]GBF12463.1 O-Antigen ligase [Tepidibacillus sp. HK-1]
MSVIFYFFLVFLYQTFDSVMVANIIYYLIMIRDIFKGKVLRIKKGLITNTFFLLFVVWVILSTAIFALSNENFSMRNLVQFLFTLQYFIFIIDLNVDLKKFERWFFRFCILLSSIIIILFIVSGQYMNISNIYTSGRLWANNYIPGWPNGTSIPLLFGLWLSIKENKSKVYSLLIIIALVLTTSRGALLGIVAIISYYAFKAMRKNKSKWIFVFIPVTVAGLIFWNDIIISIFQLVPSLEYRMSVTYDRQDIIYTTMQYISNRPFLGFGGNSLDQVIDIYGNVSQYGIKWSHTHNWILDMTLRYGFIGLILFSGFMISILLKIKDKDKQFMFLLMLVLSLFQIYMRNFAILFLMVYLTKGSLNVYDRESSYRP